MTQVVQNRKHLEATAILRFTEFRQLARRTVTEAWRCGKALSALKDVTEHGAWIPWLKANRQIDGLLEEVRQLKQELEDTTQTADELQEALGEQGLPLATLGELPSEVPDDVPEEQQVKVDKLNQRIYDLQEENRSLLTANHDLRQLVKNRDGQLAAALRNEPQVEPEPTASDRSDGIPF